MRDFRVMGKVLCKSGTLLLAKGSKVWVVQGVVCFAEIVIALGVADAVDCCFPHRCRWELLRRLRMVGSWRGR